MGKLFAASAAFALGIALGSGAWAQDNKGGAGKQSQGRSGMQTIRGMVAGITIEGETVIDYRTNKAVVAEAAYLTVVGSPEADKRDEAGKSDGQRANIYVAWLTPRTKVYEASGSDQKKEVPLDKLEVGDRVELQFSPREESAANAGANQTEQMRGKHGRNRTYVGDAIAITILPPKRDDRPPSGSQDSSKGNSENPKRDR